MYDWSTREPIQRIDLGSEGHMPLEIRFLHNPDATEGFVGCALSSTVFRFFRNQVSLSLVKFHSVSEEGGWYVEKMLLIVMNIKEK